MSRTARINRKPIQKTRPSSLETLLQAQANRVAVLRREIIGGFGSFRNNVLERALFACTNRQCRVITDIFFKIKQRTKLRNGFLNRDVNLEL